MESYGNNSIPMVVFACEDQAVKLLDIFWLKKGGDLRKQMKMLTKHALWNFKGSQRGSKIEIYKGKTCESPCHLL